MVCLQPAGLLSSMKSDEKVPEVDIDRMHTRDNLKAAKVRLTYHQPVWARTLIMLLLVLPNSFSHYIVG
jgi:hypothetical protein